MKQIINLMYLNCYYSFTYIQEGPEYYRTKIYDYYNNKYDIYKLVHTIFIELSKSNFNRVVGKEFLIGILNGIIFAIITAIIVQLWFKELNLSLLIGISMVLNMIVAGLFGILVPVSLKKLNIDPALASSVFVTTITDVIGFLSFLGLGSFYFLN